MPRYETDDYVQEHRADDAANVKFAASWRARADAAGQAATLLVDQHNGRALIPGTGMDTRMRPAGFRVVTIDTKHSTTNRGPSACKALGLVFRMYSARCNSGVFFGGAGGIATLLN